MKKHIAIIALLALICSLAAQYMCAQPYVTVPGDPMQTRIYTLDNGLKVYLSVNKEVPRVTAHIAVSTGSRNDPAETTGLAHYLEHLMFKGTKQFGTTNYALEAPLLQKISDLYEEYRTLTNQAERKAKYHEIDSVSQLAPQYNIPNEYDKMMSMIGRQNKILTSLDLSSIHLIKAAIAIPPVFYHSIAHEKCTLFLRISLIKEKGISFGILS